jgi:hypothetical protein
MRNSTLRDTTLNPSIGRRQSSRGGAPGPAAGPKAANPPKPRPRRLTTELRLARELPFDSTRAGDSSHNVEVRFVNAPPGLRSGLTSASGTAGFSLRTEHAMATP